MKTKIFSSLLVLAVSFFSLSAAADTLIDTSSCTWNQVYIGNGVNVYTLSCGGLTKTISSSCTLAAHSGYRVTGTCASFSLYRLDASSSSVSSSSAPAVCGANQGKLYTTVSSGSAIPGTISGAQAYCGTCGYTVSRNYSGSDWWDIKCN